MSITIIRLFLATLLLFGASIIKAQEVKPGNWRGVIAYEIADIPFIFNVSHTEASNPTIKLINGSEEILITNTSWRDDSLVIPMHAFDAEIIAKVSGSSMTGRWVKYYKNNSGLPFEAEFGRSRFTESGKRQKLVVPEKLKMTMTPQFGMPSDNLGLFEQNGQLITGSILADVGDYRYFEGVVTGDSINLSSFDGAHAFLLRGYHKKGQWTGELVMDNAYSEPWTGHEDNEFTLADPFVEIDPAEHDKLEPYFDILTAGSGFNSLNSEDYLGKVTIIQLLGSWCPNSLDETRYLTQWFENNKDQDVEILAVFYEFNYSKEYGMKRIDDYIEHSNIPYATALGGPANKGQAALAFPFVNKLQAFPTLMILDKMGQARYMHTYFQGPATGSYYKEFDERFNEIIDSLLKE